MSASIAFTARWALDRLGGSEAVFTDRYSEGIMATVLETFPKLLRNPSDVLSRRNLLWTSNLALNDYRNAGRRP